MAASFQNINLRPCIWPLTVVKYCLIPVKLPTYKHYMLITKLLQKNVVRILKILYEV